MTSLATYTAIRPQTDYAQPTSNPPDPQQKKLEAGAHEFEASMLGEMFKGLHFGQGVGEEDNSGEDGGSGSGGTVASFATEALGKAIAGAGGLGIAKQVLAQVSAERMRHSATLAAAEGHVTAQAADVSTTATGTSSQAAASRFTRLLP